MLDNRIHARTVVVIARIVADTAFMFTDVLPPERRPQSAEWNAIGVSLDFCGESSGRFNFWADPEFTRRLAANMLGVETGEAMAEQKTLDALKELLNIIVGNFLTEAYGDRAVFELGLPTVLEKRRLVQDYGCDNAVWLSLDDQPVLCVAEISDIT